MSEQIADKFTEALGRLESGRDLETIAALFAENSEVGNVVAPEKFNGRDGAREFWTKYRDTFGEVHSTFRNIISQITMPRSNGQPKARRAAARQSSMKA